MKKYNNSTLGNKRRRTFLAWLSGIGVSTIAYAQNTENGLKERLPKNKVKVVSVYEFGATGNGVTNDLPAFQAATAYFKGLTGTVTVPAGTYLLGNGIDDAQAIRIYPKTSLLMHPTATLIDNRKAVGSHAKLFMTDGWWRSDKAIDDYQGAVISGGKIIFNHCDYQGAFEINKAANLVLKDIVIFGDLTPQGNNGNWCIRLTNSHKINLENLHITGPMIDHQDGIHINESTEINVTGCYVSSGDDCIAVTAFREGSLCKQVKINDCTILIGKHGGIRIIADNPYAKVSVQDITVANCKIQTSESAGSYPLHLMNTGKVGYIHSCDISNVFIDSARLQPVLIERSENIRLSSVKQRNNYSHGFSIVECNNINFFNCDVQFQVYPANTSFAYMFERCTLFGVFGACLEMSPSNGFQIINSSYGRIEGNAAINISGSLVGLISSTWCTIFNNTMIGDGRGCYVIEETNGKQAGHHLIGGLISKNAREIRLATSDSTVIRQGDNKVRR